MALIALHALLGHRYAAVWVSDATLWRWAVQMAPGKYRPMTNLQKAQIQQEGSKWSEQK